MKNSFDYYMDIKEFPNDIDIIIKNIGFSHTRPNYTHGYDRREYYILHYIIDGSGTYTVNGKTYKLAAYDGFVVPPNTSVIYIADPETPWTVYWVGFYGKNVATFLERAKIDSSNLTFHYDKDDTITKDMENLFSLVQKPFRTGELLLSFVYHILGTLSSQYQTNTDIFLAHNHFYSCAQYIKNNIRLPIQVQDLAADQNLSCSQIYRIFKENSGLTPHQYIEKAKVEKACEFIRETDLSYQEISFLLGYEYISHFFKVFKRVTGYTPSTYKKLLIEDKL